MGRLHAKFKPGTLRRRIFGSDLISIIFAIYVECDRVGVGRMLPPLSNLDINAKCRPCAPVGAEMGIEDWKERDELLTREEMSRIPSSYDDDRAECAICWNDLSKPAPRGGKSIIVAVDKDISCGHAFHEECLNKWFDQQEKGFGALKCPACQSPFVDAKIDMLYNRVDGLRRRNPAGYIVRDTAGRGDNAVREPLRPHPEHGALKLGRDDAWILVLIPEKLWFVIPVARRRDWKEYTYERFKAKLKVDTLTFDRWEILLEKDAETFAMWSRYYLLLYSLKTVKEEVLDAYDTTKQSAVALLKDVRERREQGSTWKEIMSALVLGEEPEDEGP